MPAVSIIVPAHNEEGVIRRLLSPLCTSSSQTLDLEVIVVTNGCTDATATIAREMGARVIELTIASKAAALNAGDAAASHPNRLFVDADISVSVATILEVAVALESTPFACIVAPTMLVDTRRSSAAVKAYYRVWAQTDYRLEGMVGSGFYALNREARSRFKRFPDVIADDRWIQLQFAPDERRVLSSCTFSVEAPRTTRALVHRGVRIASGNAELVDVKTPGADGRLGRVLRLVGRVLRMPKLWLPVPIYFGITLRILLTAQVLRALRREVGWNRDETTREDG